jgi:hypothetical protein
MDPDRRGLRRLWREGARVVGPDAAAAAGRPAC